MTNAEPSLSEVVSRRREELDLSQSELAWLARVSRNTISNLERGHGTPASATLNRVAHALGGNQYAISSIATGESSAGPGWSGLQGLGLSVSEVWLTPSDVAKAALSLIIALDAAVSVIDARRAADAWRDVHEAKTILDRNRSDFGVSENRLEAGMKTLREVLLPHLSDDEPSNSIRSWFQDHGWSPEDDLPRPSTLEERVPVKTSLGQILPDQVKHAVRQAMTEWEEAQGHSVADNIEAVAQHLESNKQQLSAFQRLPLLVQDKLSKGHVLDYEVHQSDANLSHIVLTVSSTLHKVDREKALEAHINALMASVLGAEIMDHLARGEVTFETLYDEITGALNAFNKGKRNSTGNLDLGRFEARKEPEGNGEAE